MPALLGKEFPWMKKPGIQARDTQLEVVGNRDTSLVLGSGVT